MTGFLWGVFGLAFTVLASVLVLSVAGVIYRRWGTHQRRTLSPRDGGLPENIIPPRSRWHLRVARCGPGLACKITRRSEAEARATTSAPYVVKWMSWSLVLAGASRVLHVYRWRERWGS